MAPLQIGRGIQNKVLEAMAMGMPVVATPQAREGLDACRDDELLTATTPADFAAAVGSVLDGDAGPIGARARARVVRDYGWDASLAGLDRLFDAGENDAGCAVAQIDIRHCSPFPREQPMTVHTPKDRTSDRRAARAAGLDPDAALDRRGLRRLRSRVPARDRRRDQGLERFDSV